MDKLEALRHTCAHILAHAVRRLYPQALPTIGPTIENGFYYDFYNLNIKEEDLPKIEAEMHKIIKENHKLKRLEKSKKESEAFVRNNRFKQEILKDLKEGEVSFYEQGDFIDLCRGGHLESTGDVKAVKLLKTAGAYWRGDAKNPQLTRIYGTAWNTEKELRVYLHNLEEAEKRNHIKLGKDLNLFHFHEESPGAPFFYPKGTIIYSELVNFIREEYQKRGYQEVITPLLYDKSLWMTSGHWEHFKDDMFIQQVDGREFSLKPMNCPSHCLIYSTNSHSYRELPIRIADFAALHRNEIRGALHGLIRTRKFSQDDSHIFCREDQIEQEVSDLLDFAKKVFTDTFKMKYQMVLSTRPEKAMGDIKLWEKAEHTLEAMLKKHKIDYKINKGDGAFYGPKIDLLVEDLLGRKWQLSTIQLDFQMPRRFNIFYIDEKDNKCHPVMIHKAILGSLERFIGVITEHFAGKFPLWLNPEQVRIMTVTNRNDDFAKSIFNKLKENRIRVKLDDSNETISKKVRDAQLEKVNYMITIGDKEVENKTLAIRTRDGKITFGVKTDAFISQLREEIEKRVLN